MEIEGNDCSDCKCNVSLEDATVRWNMSQESKEALNILLDSGYNREDFCFCIKKGEIRSLIADLECTEWEMR